MSKSMSPEELKKHCEKATSALGGILKNFSESQHEKFKKRAMLIAYWVKTYVRYINKEDSFSPQSVYRLKRGSVVLVEFGYRVGRELGGRHYAVVLDANNSIYRNTVTVVPLGSIKEKEDKKAFRLELRDGVYKPVLNKLAALKDESSSIMREVDEMEKTIATANPADISKLRTVQRAKAEQAKVLAAQAEEWNEEIDHMKAGSAALVDQVTTISKMRITQPLKKTHPLYGIRLSAQDMDAIDNELKKLFFQSQKNV